MNFYIPLPNIGQKCTEFYGGGGKEKNHLESIKILYGKFLIKKFFFFFKKIFKITSQILKGKWILKNSWIQNNVVKSNDNNNK